MNHKYDANETLFGEKHFIQMTLPRLESVGTPMEAFLFARSAIARVQIAATEVTGCHFLETSIGEAEFQGVTFRYCTFKKVRFDVLAMRQVRFEHCTFEEVTFTTPMEPAPIDGIEFRSCHIHDAQGAFHALLSKKDWDFENCVIAAAHSVENDSANTYLPLLAFVPAKVEEKRPVTGPVALSSAMNDTPKRNDSPAGPPQIAPPKPAPAPEAKPRPAAGRFDQLEIG